MENGKVLGRSHDLSEMEDMMCNINNGMNAINAIHAAMSDSPFSPDNFVDGLFFVWDNLSNDVRALNEIFERMKGGIA